MESHCLEGDEAQIVAVRHYLKHKWSAWESFLWRLMFCLPLRVFLTRDGRKPYLLRGVLIPRLTSWLPSLNLHFGFRADEEYELHNHPWLAFSWILAGGYGELRHGYSVFRKPGRVVMLTRNTFHRILNGGWFSLFLMFKHKPGPDEESWGFWNPETGSYWHWAEYIRLKRGIVK